MKERKIHAKEKFDPKRATTGVLVPNIEKSLPNKFLPRFCQKLSPRRKEQREKERTKILAAIFIDKDSPITQVLSEASHPAIQPNHGSSCFGVRKFFNRLPSLIGREAS